MRAPAPRRVVLPLLALLVGVLSACGVRKEYFLDDVDVRRLGWDTLRVDARFAWRTAVGGPRNVAPDEASVTVFDGAYDTLYAGPPGPIPVPDRRLSDRERLTVEVCGAFGARLLCEQRVARASPKRIRVDQDIEYPLEGDYDEGRYDLTYHVERQAFDGDGWEAIDEVPEIRGYLLAWVGDQEQDAVRIPFDAPRGRFDLTRYDNYRDFKYYLENDLIDEREARVSFDVYGGIRGQVARLSSERKDVRVKSTDERRDEVRHFVQAAAADLVDALRGGRGAVAYVEDWRYDLVSRTYRVALRVEWRGSVFGGRRIALEGALRVGEQGRTASFTLHDANRRGRAVWEDRVDGDVLQLEPIAPYVPPAESLDEPADDRAGALRTPRRSPDRGE